MVTAGILPFMENSHSRAGNPTRDLMISSQRLWPLENETGPIIKIFIMLISSKTQIATLRQFNNGHDIGNKNSFPGFSG